MSSAAAEDAEHRQACRERAELDRIAPALRDLADKEEFLREFAPWHPAATASRLHAEERWRSAYFRAFRLTTPGDDILLGVFRFAREPDRLVIGPADQHERRAS